MVIPSIHWRKCQAGHVEHLDDLYSKPLPQKVKPASPVMAGSAEKITNYGYKLAEIIKRETGEEIKCNECRSEVGRLNRMTADQILLEIDSLSDAIVNRGKEKAPKLWQRLVCTLAPGEVRQRVAGWIEEAIK